MYVGFMGIRVKFDSLIRHWKPLKIGHFRHLGLITVTKV